MVHDDVHVRLQPDVARHGLANPDGAMRHCVGAVYLVHPDHSASGWYIAAAASTSCALKALASQRSTRSGDGAPLTISLCCAVSVFIL